jgi:hypothetical protein
MDLDGFIITNNLHDGICTKCTGLAGKVDIIFGDGTRADVKDGIYLRHILMFDQPKVLPDFVYCPARSNSFLANLMSNPLGSAFLGAAVNEFMILYTKPLWDGVSPLENVKAVESGY